MKPLLFVLLSMVSARAQQVPRPAPPMNLLAPCKGKPALLAFVVTTCSHCKAFTRRVMEPLYEQHHVCAMAIAFDEGGDTARFAREQGLTFPVYRVERRVMQSFLGMTGPDRIVGTPQVVVIDRHGVIQAQSKPEGTPLLLQMSVIRQILEELR